MEGARGMAGHRRECVRFRVLDGVHKHINLSTTERDLLVNEKAEKCPACNCKYGGAMGYGRDVRTLERLVTDAVLEIRALAIRRAIGVEVKGQKAEMILEDEEGSGQIIRIDFRNRRRII